MRWLPLLILAAMVAGWPQAASATCAAWAPTKDRAPRSLIPQDLIELRDIGDPDSGSFGQPSRVAVSPDGRRVAFSIIRADLASNAYCLGVFVMDIAIGTLPQEVEAGGDPLPAIDNLRGNLVDSGGLAPVIPAWSPDGRWLAFLRRDQGVTRLWIAGVDGSGSHAVTQFDDDVAQFQWAADSRTLLFATHPALIAHRQEVLDEGRTGWLYDRRIMPPIGPTPLPPAGTSRAVFAIDRSGESRRPATAAEIGGFPAEPTPGVPMPPIAIARDGSRALTERQGASPLAPLSLVVIDHAGHRTICTGDWCRGGITGLWWSPEGALFVLHREGWNQSEMVLYRWTSQTGPRAIFRTEDDIQDCEMTANGLLCTRENAVTPRRIVLINLRSGRHLDIFDPNPVFAKLALGHVRRLKARNSLGLESWADLVLPPDYQRGAKLPMVIVQYHSNGFLRGGTGDEYPIFLLAQRGFAVLSFERPPFVAMAYPNAKTAAEINAIILKDWAERRNTLSSLDAEVALALATGAIDPKRIGISGLSDGASTVQYAMINSARHYAAAAVSTCCYEPKAVTAYAGPAFSDFVRSIGFPGAVHDDPDFWRPSSFIVSGQKTDTPLLMQLADSEYINGLESYEALLEYGKTVEMRVFPGEFHIKRQPVHRLAIYDRSLDWFSFWLQGRIDPDPAKQDEFARWQAMKARR